MTKEEKDIQQISSVTVQKGMLRTRHVVTVDGRTEKFGSEEKANAYRDEQLALQQQQRDRREAERRATEQKAADERARAEYDRDPEYFVMSIRPPLVEQKKKVRNFVAAVDVQAYTREINTACFELSQRGYEVVSITPFLSGYGDFENSSKSVSALPFSKDAGNVTAWGAGWGYSYTDGVVLLARKIRKGDAKPGVERSD